MFEEPFIVPKYEIVVDDNLGFTCFIYGWLLPEDHFLYKTYIRTISNVGIPELLRFVITDICICPGIMNSINDGLLLHAVPRKITPNRVKLALQKERLKCSQLQKKVGQMQQEITSQGVKLDDPLSSDINKIMAESIDISPFMKLFWEQQKESVTKASTGMGYHPGPNLDKKSVR